jgi:hypothetical protein
MSGLVARRNDPLFWQGRVDWVKLGANRKPVCDDCLIATHDAGGAGTIARATWRRITDYVSTNLCARHKGEWESWTPGQMELLPLPVVTGESEWVL